MRNWCWHYCPMGKGRDHFLSCSVTEISKSFVCIYFPLIKKKKLKIIEILEILNVCPTAPGQIPAVALKTPCRETGLHFMLGWLLQQEGNLSPLTMVSPVSRSCLSLVPLPTIWPENQVPVKGKILHLGLRRVLQGVPGSPMLGSLQGSC